MNRVGRPATGCGGDEGHREPDGPTTLTGTASGLEPRRSEFAVRGNIGDREASANHARRAADRKDVAEDLVGPGFGHRRFDREAAVRFEFRMDVLVELQVAADHEEAKTTSRGRLELRRSAPVAGNADDWNQGSRTVRPTSPASGGSCIELETVVSHSRLAGMPAAPRAARRGFRKKEQMSGPGISPRDASTCTGDHVGRRRARGRRRRRLGCGERVRRCGCVPNVTRRTAINTFFARHPSRDSKGGPSFGTKRFSGWSSRCRRVAQLRVAA